MELGAQQYRAFALALAAVAWFSVLLQCYLSLELATQNGKSLVTGMGIFLSYFTVLTNLLICVSLTFSLSAPSSTLGKIFSRPDAVAGIAASIALVGLSYYFLLRNIWSPQGARWLADVLLHYVVPVSYLFYWWFGAAKTALSWVNPLRWSVYPVAYLAYALIRGHIVGSYPYPFIDVADLGYGRTILNSFGLLFVFLSLGYLLVAVGRMRQSARDQV